MSKITVTTIAGATSGADANKVKIESGDTLEVTSNATVGGTLGVTGATTFTDIVGDNISVVNNQAAHTNIDVFNNSGSASAKSQIRVGYDASNCLEIFRVGNNANIIQNATQNGSIIFQGAGTEMMRMSTAGLAIGGTGAANTLNDYEEGTWTPAFSSQIGSISMGQQAGRYQRTGNFVTANFWISWSSITGNGSYGVQVTGLPFTSVAQIVSPRDVGIILIAGHENVPVLNNNYHQLGGYMNQNATTATFRMIGGGQAERSLDGSIAKSSGYVYGMVRYKAV